MNPLRIFSLSVILFTIQAIGAERPQPLWEIGSVNQSAAEFALA